MGNSCQRWLKLFAVHLLGGTGQTQGLPLQWWRGVRTPVAGLNRSNCPRRWGLRRGRCGGTPPAQGRAEGPTAQRQWIVGCCQKRRRLPCSGSRIGYGLVVTRGIRKFTPILDYTPSSGAHPRIGGIAVGDCSSDGDEGMGRGVQCDFLLRAHDDRYTSDREVSII